MEIKPQELRIGNWVKWPDEKEPNEVQWSHGHWLGVFEKNYGYPHAIDLTPEWLEKFGFKRGDNVTASDAFYVKTVGVSELAVNPDNGVCWISNRNGSINNPACIDNVHSLQNLYFALTGKELAIDSKSL